MILTTRRAIVRSAPLNIIKIIRQKLVNKIMTRDGDSTAKDLATAFLRTGTSTIVGFAFRAGAVKILALLTGPAGIAAFGLIRQLIDLGLWVATAGNASAVVQGVSSRAEMARDNYIRTSAIVFASSALLTAALFIAAGPTILDWIAPDAALLLTPLLPWIAIAVLVNAAGAYVSAVVNGQGQYREIVVGGALGGVALALAAWPVGWMATRGHFAPYALAQVLPPLVIIAFAFRPLAPRRWLPGLWRTAGGGVDGKAAREVIALSSWLGISSLIAALGITALRLMMLHEGGLDTLGMFTAAYQIAISMLALMGGPLHMFHLPALSAHGEPTARRALLGEIFSFSRLFAASYTVTLIAAKPLLLRVLYSNDFLPALAFLDWLLPALYFQSLYMVLGSAMAAKRLGGAACAMELVRTGGFVLLSAVAIFIAHDPYLLGPAYFLSRVVAYFGALTIVRRAYGGSLFADTRSTLSGFAMGASVLALGGFALNRTSIDGPLLLSAALALVAICAAATRTEWRAILSFVTR